MGSISGKEHKSNWQKLAEKNGLIYIDSFERGIKRIRCGKGFKYVTRTGRKITSKQTISRIKGLVIPPAWEEVWICSKPEGHIQVMGFDTAGRRQYIYHPAWSEISSLTKHTRLKRMPEVLPRLRQKIRRDLNSKKISKPRIVAAIVRLLDRTKIRIGNKIYAVQNGSRGATTLKRRHVSVKKPDITLDYPGKSGKRRVIQFSDIHLAKVIKQCESIRSRYLFCYQTEEGELEDVTSADVNQYLQMLSEEEITAKDFRTWWGSVIALSCLKKITPSMEPSERNKQIIAAINETAEELGNTRAVCKSSYIHPGLLAAAESGELPRLLSQAKKKNTRFPRGLTADERIFAGILPYLERYLVCRPA